MWAVRTVDLTLFFVVQAIYSPVLLDDWFELRYWRDHEFGLTALWQNAHHNYLFYNPRLGESVLALVDGSRVMLMGVGSGINAAAAEVLW